MTRVSIADDLAGSADVEVELWGALYDLVQITRSRQKAIIALEHKVADLDDSEDSVDQMVECMALIVDQALKPQNGKRKLASAHILEKWNSDDLTLEQLSSFVERLADARRPT